MINAISAADIAFIMSSSTSAWLPSPLECSPQKQNAERFASVSEDELCRLIEEKDSKNTKRATLFRQRFYYCILKFLNDLS